MMMRWMISGAALLIFGLLLGTFHSTSERLGIPGAPDSAVNASNTVPTGGLGVPSKPLSPEEQLGQALVRWANAAVEAEKRGEHLGTSFWNKTPEDVLDALFNRFEEPFHAVALDRLAKALPKLESATDQVKAAALLHRYGKTIGTAFLRELAGKTEEGSSLAATVLAKTQDGPSIPVLVRRLTQFPWDQLGLTELEAIGAWSDPQLTRALIRRSERAESNRNRIARALVQHGVFDAWDGLPAATLEAMRSERIYRLDLEAVSARRGGRAATDWGDQLFSGLRRESTLPDTRILSSARLAGPIAGQESLERFLNEYIDHNTQWNAAYQEHVTAIKNGSKEWSFFGDSTYKEAGVSGALDLLAEWGGDRATEITYRHLETCLKGPHSPLTVETILSNLVRLDPQGVDARAAAMGIDPSAVASAKTIATLRPLPSELMPRQLPKSHSVFP